MRTTLTIQDELLQEAKQVSLQRNCTLGELVEEALRIFLLAKSKGKKAHPFRPIKTYSGNGLQPGVDLNASSDPLNLMENP
jgi:hypothetical protein